MPYGIKKGIKRVLGLQNKNQQLSDKQINLTPDFSDNSKKQRLTAVQLENASKGTEGVGQLARIANSSMPFIQETHLLETTLGIVSTATLAAAPPIGIAVAGVSLLIIKGIQTYRANSELVVIYKEIIEILKFICDNFDLESNDEHIKRLKEHIYKIYNLCITVDKLFKWRGALFPNSIINSFMKEITFINSELIIDLKTMTNLKPAVSVSVDPDPAIIGEIQDAIPYADAHTKEGIANVLGQIGEEAVEKSGELTAQIEEQVDVNLIQSNKDTENIANTGGRKSRKGGRKSRKGGKKSRRGGKKSRKGGRK
jgi:hypothetical protein